MQVVVYDGSLDGLLCAIFDVYEYKFTDVSICTEQRFQGNIFEKVHKVITDKAHSERVWKGLEKKLSIEALHQFHQTFLSEQPGIEDVLLHYAQYVFSSTGCVEADFSHSSVLTVTQIAKKVWRETHRMQAFVRFQKTADELYYAIIEPDYNVLPLIREHFQKRYADQRWLIYDARRKYGIYYDLHHILPVEIDFDATTNSGKNINAVYNEEEILYQQLWQQYFKSVNIAARKNKKTAHQTHAGPLLEIPARKAKIVIVKIINTSVFQVKKC